MRKLLVIEAESQDIGGTQLVTLRMGDSIIGYYGPGTRHPDYALAEVERLLAASLNRILKPELAPMRIDEKQGLQGEFDYEA